VAKRRSKRPRKDPTKERRSIGLTGPTPEMQPYLSAIRDLPAEDGPRLAFADWLVKTGYRTWGELLRVQCELEHLPHQVMRSDCILHGRDAIARRRQEVRNEEEAAQLAMIEREYECLQRREELPLFWTREDETRDFERGLPVGSCSIDSLEAFRAAFASNPAQFDWLDTLTITNEHPGVVFDLMEMLSRPMRWGFYIDIGARKAASYEGWERLSLLDRLRSLSVNFVHDPNAEAGYSAITRLPCPALERFELFIVGFDSARLNRLASAPWPALKSLRIGNSRMSSEQFRELAECMGPRLLGLELCENEMDANVLIALCKHGLFRGVDFVDNRGAPLSDESMKALANCPEACNLTQLHLGSSGLTDAGLLMIANSPNLRNVDAVFVDNNQITDAGVEALTDSSNGKNYQRLDLSGNPIGDRSVKALVQASLPRLHELGLDEVRMTSAGALSLMQSEHFEESVGISLQYNKLAAAVRKQLRKHFGENVILQE
jgi:uncharacterized protein (TIGR02996 family)